MTGSALKRSGRASWRVKLGSQGKEELPRSMGEKWHMRHRGIFDGPCRVWWRCHRGGGEGDRWESEGPALSR